MREYKSVQIRKVITALDKDISAAAKAELEDFPCTSPYQFDDMKAEIVAWAKRVANARHDKELYIRLRADRVVDLKDAIATERRILIEGSDFPMLAGGVSNVRITECKTYDLLRYTWEVADGRDFWADFPAKWDSDEYAQESFLVINEEALTEQQTHALELLDNELSTQHVFDEDRWERRQLGSCD